MYSNNTDFLTETQVLATNIKSKMYLLSPAIVLRENRDILLGHTHLSVGHDTVAHLLGGDDTHPRHVMTYTYNTNW